ncbi:armadillo-type protein [Xylariaceae sp. FL0594]|nr:armadillo-type protein [Xylariaceae sp. FL0594]
MAPKTDSGNKRKLPSRSKDSSSKKPKFEKRPPPPKEVQEDSISDDSDNADFSDHDDEGGAQLNGKVSHENGKKQVDNQNGQGSKTFEKGQNSRESHIKQKQLAQERKANKPLADELQRAKKLWERLRRKSHVPKDERVKLVEELFAITTGRMKEFVLKHDAVRVVQTAIKYSTPERRKMIAKELQGTYPTLAESRYAKFLIGKLIVEGDKEVRDMIVPEFYGRVRKMINHPEASWILDDIYRGVASKEQKAILLREWYGPDTFLFGTKKDDKDTAPTAELSEILEKEPSKRAPIMRYLLDMTNQLIQKKMTGFTMLHDAMYQYYTNVKPGSEEAKEYMEMIKEDENDLLKNMGFTKFGARLVCLLLAHGTAKDRKQLLRAYKDTFQLMSTDPHGHLIILTAYDTIDDTVLTSKSIVSELLPKTEPGDSSNILTLANDPNGKLTIRYLLEGASKSLFDASHAGDLELLEQIWELRKTTSKKDPEIRRKELVAALSPPLLAAIASSAVDLVSTSFGCQLVTEALLSCVGDKSAALEAVASTAGGDPDTRAEEDSEGLSTSIPSMPHISKIPHGGRMFKTLISGGHFDKAARKVIPCDPPLHFGDILYPVIQEHIISWATGPSSFVVLNLLETDDFSHADELKKTLKKHKKQLQKAATEETPEQKSAREAAKANADDEKEKSAQKAKKGPSKEKAVGNLGSKLLLEKLGA